jgi:hypothetical protein
MTGPNTETARTETGKPAGYKPPSRRPGYKQPSRRGETFVGIPVPAQVAADWEAIAKSKGTTRYSLMKNAIIEVLRQNGKEWKHPPDMRRREHKGTSGPPCE